MANRRALLGIVPQCVQPPPILANRSTTATFRPCLHGLHRRPFAAGAGADDDHVVLVLCHEPILRGQGRNRESGVGSRESGTYKYGSISRQRPSRRRCQRGRPSTSARVISRLEARLAETRALSWAAKSRS